MRSPLPVVLLLLAARLAFAAPTAVGTWTATVDGERVTVVFDATGRGTFSEGALTWRQDAGVITVQIADGTVVRGRLDGDVLRFVVDGEQLTFRRVGKAQDAAPQRAAFKPSKVLPGKRVTPKGTQLSFVVPKGWTSGWETRDGTDVYVVAKGKHIAIVGTARQLSTDERKLSPSALLTTWAPPAAGVKTVEAAVEFTLKGQPGAIVVHESTVAPTLRMAAAVAVVDGWGIVLVALSPPAHATTARHGLDTMLATLAGGVPSTAPAATAGSSGAIGCWSSYESHGRSGSSTRKVIIAADGTYSWTGSSNFAGTGSSRSTELGTWTADGARITMVPSDGGKTETYHVRISGRTLQLGGNKFTRCP